MLTGGGPDLGSDFDLDLGSDAVGVSYFESRPGKLDLDAVRVQWAGASTSARRLILAGRIVSLFGVGWVNSEQAGGWRDPMLRDVVRALSILS